MNSLFFSLTSSWHGYTRLRHNIPPEMCSKSEEILEELTRKYRTTVLYGVTY